MTNTDFFEEPRLSLGEVNDLVKKMDQLVELIDVEEGVTIVSAGEFDSTIYIVAEGEVVVEVPVKGRWVAVAWLTQGSVIGELSFFDSGPRAARIMSRTGCKLYSVSREAFDTFSSNFPTEAMRFVWRISEIMAYRLRRIEQFDAIEHGRDEERKGLAADLHDQTMNDLSAIVMYLGLLKANASKVSQEIVSEIETISGMVKGADKKLREIVKGMAQDSVVRIGLSKSLEEHFEEISTNNHHYKGPLTIRFTREGVDSTKLPEAVAIDIFNIVHQAVANSLSHSQAQLINVDLCWSSKTMSFSIQDDGIGFDMSAAKKKVESNHFGLLNLKLRAERMSGTLTLDSSPGNGTTISGSIPIRNDTENPSPKLVTDYPFSD